MRKRRGRQAVIKLLAVAAVFIALAAVLALRAKKQPEEANQPSPPIASGVTENGAGTLPPPASPSKESGEWARPPDNSPPDKPGAGAVAQDMLDGMTLKEKIYQMFMATPESITGAGSVTAAGETTRGALEEHPVGGIVYFSVNLQTPEQTTTMISNAQSYSRIPLFIALDEEGGIVARIGGNPKFGTTVFPPMAEIGARNNPDEAYQVGAVIGADIRQFGFNLDFAPVADIITNQNNTEIGSRSFSTDPEVAAAMVAQMVKGLQDSSVIATLKHFPGHGSTQANSHNGYSESARTLEEMESAEFIPFIAGIDAGAGFVMVSHMSAVNVTGDQMPSSLSKVIITDLLRNQLGFAGIVITDALQMGAITSRYTSGEAAVLAVKAGADMLLCSMSTASAANALYNAVITGEIPEARIDESVLRILRCKIDRGLITGDLTKVNTVGTYDY